MSGNSVKVVAGINNQFHNAQPGLLTPHQPPKT
jgi:hypothetical protein